MGKHSASVRSGGPSRARAVVPARTCAAPTYRPHTCPPPRYMYCTPTTPTSGATISICTTLLECCSALAGFFVRLSKVGAVIGWFPPINPIHFALMGFVYALVSEETTPYPAALAAYYGKVGLTGEDLLEKMSLTAEHGAASFSFAVGGLLVWQLLMRIITVVALAVRVRRLRPAHGNAKAAGAAGASGAAGNSSRRGSKARTAGAPVAMTLQDLSLADEVAGAASNNVVEVQVSPVHAWDGDTGSSCTNATND